MRKFFVVGFILLLGIGFPFTKKDCSAKELKIQLDTIKQYSVTVDAEFGKYVGLKKSLSNYFDGNTFHIASLTKSMDSVYILQVSKSSTKLKKIKLLQEIRKSPYYSGEVFLLPNNRFTVLGMSKKPQFGFYNYQGELLAKREAVVNRNGQKYRPWGICSNPYIYNNRKLYLPTYNYYQTSEYFDLPVGMQLDLDKYKVKKTSNIYFPSNYKDHYYYDSHFFFYSCDQKENPICSFAYNDSVFVFPNKGKSKKAYYAGSSLKHEFIEDDKEKLIDRNYVLSLQYKPKYYSFVYDSVSHCYIRGYLHKVQYSGSTIKKPNLKNRKKSWIILDQDLNLLEELTTDDVNLPFLGAVYPTQDGLWNITKTQEEDKIIFHFTLLRLRKTESIEL
ncbi:MAG: hypothetical protein ACEPOW_09860 [Bacteroidales bacterium]